MIEEAHERALAVLREHMDELHRLSAILIERETIDKDQFLRLLEGGTEDEVFPEETPAPAEEQPSRERKPAPKPKPFPVPGAMMQRLSPKRPRARPPATRRSSRRRLRARYGVSEAPR